MILQAALTIVDRDGVDRLSMRRLSDELGRDPVMLYHHPSLTRPRQSATVR